MPLETAVEFISDFNPQWPTPGDPKQRGDDHIREMKRGIQNTFPLVKGVIPIAHDQFASKEYVNNAAFSTALPGQPGGAISYRLTTRSGIATWQKDSIFSDQKRLAEAHAIALSLG